MSDRIVNTNGAAVLVTESGAGEPTLVFPHYWGGSSRTWQPVIERLRGKPRAVPLNQRGWDGSVAPRWRYDLAAMADDTQAVACAMG